MKLLIIDPYGDALDLSIRAKRDSHQVKHFIRSPLTKPNVIGKGLVELVPGFESYLKWADVIFCADNTLYLHELAAYRKRHGTLIVGPTPEAAQWELDRELGQKILKLHGVPTIPYKVFNNYDKAAAFVKKENRRFVCKPCGNELDKSLSYLAKTPADMLYMLERWKKAGKHKGSFLLQDFVEGIEMSADGWFGPGGFNRGWSESFEFKKFMNDDKGPNTGEQGTVLRYVAQSKLAAKVLTPLEDPLAEMGYVGYVSVNCIIDDAGNPWPLELTMRPGWPTFNIEAAVRIGDSVEWLAMLAIGQDARNILLDSVALGVVLAMPDYPYSKSTKKDACGVPIYGLDEKTWPWVGACQLMAGSAPFEKEGKFSTQPCIVSAGDYLMVVSANGETVSRAKERAYKRVEKFTIPNSLMYRTDIGMRLKKQLPELQANGYATNLRF
jgi:phosphoribosylamine--glycine ligase